MSQPNYASFLRDVGPEELPHCAVHEKGPSYSEASRGLQSPCPAPAWPTRSLRGGFTNGSWAPESEIIAEPSRDPHKAAEWLGR